MSGIIRNVIPTNFTKKVLNLLHEKHWGVVKMRQLAQRYVLCPNINRDIENLLQSCTFCR